MAFLRRERYTDTSDRKIIVSGEDALRKAEGPFN